MKTRHLTMRAVVCAALLSSLFSRPARAVFSQQGPKLVGTGADFGIQGLVGVYQGWSTAISADGKTAIIGGYADANGNGAAWVFTRSGSAWSQQGPKLFANIGGGDFQGIAVGLSADGNTAIIGADVNNNGVGAAYIWTRSGGVWHFGTKLLGSNVLGGGALQGYSVALSGDGHTAIVGGTFDNAQVGAAWIFTGGGGTWHEQRKLVGTGSSGPSEQGWSVALSFDGNTAAVGGYTDNTITGAVWIYTRSGGTWTQQGSKLTVAGGVAFGSSVSLSSNGNVALLGGYNDNASAGAAWVWTRSGSVWTQQGNKLFGTGASGIAQQGTSVSISADGNTALVGGPGDNGGAGAAWTWKRSGSTWTQLGAKLVGSGAVGAASQGSSVALSGDGKTALVGGYSDGVNGNAGAAWIFADSAPVATPGRSSGTVVAPGVPIPAVIGSPGSGHFLQHQPKLVGSGAVNAVKNGVFQPIYQGWSVALSGDGETAIVGGIGDNDIGAAWIWKRNFSFLNNAVGYFFSQDGNKLVSSTGGVNTPGSFQGWSVALDFFADDAYIGGYGEHSGTGGVSNWLDASTNGAPRAWLEFYTFVGSGATGPAFQGFSVSVGGDFADFACAVGGPSDDNQVGAAWIFDQSIFSSSTPNPLSSQKLVASDAVGKSQQGWSVGVSAPSRRAIVGGYTDNNDKGAAWIWESDVNNVWHNKAKLVGSGAVGSAFQGSSVAISIDGKTAIVGGYNDHSGIGAAWIWTFNGSSWVQQGNKLVATNAIGASQQGTSVSISADGDTVLIGGPGDNGGAGAAWVWKRDGTGVWAQYGPKLVGVDAVGPASQGHSVSLSADGKTAIIGGHADNFNNGAAWIFVDSAR